ncbi:MAG: alcohol dehydrogenase catalytic domain-containing protein, partial [Armatimonadota bacterium]|nr:alcohol dehydrogenase catalytic domain-containing protein [Armatimonadota bacterium]
MKAAFFGGKGQMRLAELDPPQPGPGEVVMAVTACGVCGSDLHSFAGQWPQPPVVPGHEMAGRVAAVGAGVTELAVGDAVTLEPFVSCGECRWCRSGHYNVCPQHEFISWHRHGGFAEQVLAPARCFLPLPEGPAREFGFLVEPLAVAVHALRRAPLRGADQVAVLGAGAIGLLAAAAAHALGAGRVVVVAKHPHQAELAEAMGAHAVVRLGEGKPDDIIRAAVGPDGADVVVDAAGSSQSIDLAVRAARRGGSL